MGSLTVNNIKKTVKLILGDKFSDALADPKSTLLDIPYEHLELLVERVSVGDLALLAESLEDQELYETLAVARDYLNQVSARMSLFRKDTLNLKSEKYFIDLGIDTSRDNAARDLNDLKRLVEGNLGGYFSVNKHVSHFMTGDIMECYFDKCLDDFKVNRDIEFADLFKKRLA